MGVPTLRPDNNTTEPPSDCPPWCDPTLCNADDGSGSHQSARASVPATNNEACAVDVWITRSALTDATLFTVEVQYDPDFCSALGIPADPDAFVFSHGQARQLRRTLTRLLDAA